MSKIQLSNAQEVASKKLMRLQSSINTDERLDSFSLDELEEKLNRLNYLFEDYEAKCLKIECDNDAEETAIRVQLDEAEKSCSLLKKKLKMRIKESETEQLQGVGRQEVQNEASSLPSQTQSVNNTQTQNVQHLAKLSLDSMAENAMRRDPNATVKNTWGIFNGNLSNWLQFKEHFEKAVHQNENLTDDEKLGLLKGACENDVAVKLNNFRMDYANAWARLLDLYDNAYVQIHFWMNKALTIPPCEYASQNTLQKLLMRGTKCVENLSKTVNIESFEAVFVPIIAGKLDEQTLHFWERFRCSTASSWANETRSASQHIPKWVDFSKFIEAEIVYFSQSEMRLDIQRMRPEMNSSLHNEANAARFVQNNVRNSVEESLQALIEEKRRVPIFLQCVLCIFIHPRYKCEKYKEMSFEQKHQHVHQYNLCVKCLKPSHGNAPCDDPRCNEKCPTCEASGIDDYHNSSLCPTKHAQEAAGNRNYFR